MSKKRRVFGKIKNSKLLEIIEDSHIGIIESIDDPDFVGRCKIRVFGVFGDNDDSLGKIPTEDLPYAYPYYDLISGSASGSGKYSTPKVGTTVRVYFENDIYHPRYYAIEELDDELKEIIKNDYEGFHSLLYDSDDTVKLYYAKKTGWLFELAESYINIEPNGAIVIHHRTSSSVIEIRGSDIDIVTNNSFNVSTPNNITINTNQLHCNGAQTDLGANPIYSNVNGEMMMKLFLALATGMDLKYPSTPGQFANLVNQMEQLILSKTVKTTP